MNEDKARTLLADAYEAYFKTAGKKADTIRRGESPSIPTSCILFALSLAYDAGWNDALSDDISPDQES